MSAPSSPGSSGIPPTPDEAAVPDARITTWLALQAALVPIIGPGGFAALYQRSLHLALPTHPWLPPTGEIAHHDVSFEPLLRALSQQPPQDAAAAQEFLLRSFLDTLANLIGPSLVQRLLGTVVVAPFQPPPEQDSHP